METAFRSEERFTQAEFLDWLESLPASDINHYELLGGRIVMTPPARSGHGSIEAKIGAELEIFARKSDAGRAYGSSTGYDLPSGDTVEPDASFVSSATLARGPRPDPKKFLRVVPDLVVEILSPSSARRDRTEKKQVYAGNRVAEYWIVNPDSRRVAVFRLEGAAYGSPVEIEGGTVESSALPGLSIPLERLFADLD